MKARLELNNSQQNFVSGLRILGVFLMLISFSAILLAQSANRLGTQAENKGGVSWSSTFATDKIETVNLANGNLSINLPLVTIGGRGSAALTVMLSYNSKVWTGETQSELVDEGGIQWYRRHYNARWQNWSSGSTGGWKLSGAPFIKTQYVEIDHYSAGCSIQEAGCYKYALTKATIALPDGSEVELRDELTNGAPHLSYSNGDRDRGRIWKSTDGSFITYVTDAANGVVTDQLSGWVFLADGTRLRIESGNPSYGYGKCTQIIDRNGNILTIDYGILNPGATTFVDQLGRQVILGGAGVTIKGYQGAGDRVISGQWGETLQNLRSDQPTGIPIINGDYDNANDRHISGGEHIDLFGATASYFMTESPGAALKEITLLDGRKFQFRYNIYGEVAEIIYPGGGKSQMDYGAFGADACEGGGAVNSFLNRRVTERRLYASGTNLESTWSYIYGGGWVNGTLYPTAQIKAFEGNTSGTLLMDEKHYFLAIDANYRYGCGTTATRGSGYERWDNAKEFRVEKQTGSGMEIVERTWAQRASVVFAPDPNSGMNAYAQEHGQEQPQNDPRLTQEDTILEDGKMKRTTFQYDDFNNVTLITEHDFGTAGNAGAVLRKTERSYLSNQNGYCYTNLNGLDANCAGGIPSNLGAVIHQKHLLLSERILDASNNQKTLTEYEYDYYTTDTNHAPIVSNSGMINYDGTRFGLFSSAYQPRGNATRVKNWVENTAYIYAHNQYDNAGHLIKAIDAKGNISTISYADNFGNGTNPDTGASGASGATFAIPTLATNPLGWQTKSQYDFTLGAVTGTKDINGVISRSEYDTAGRVFRTTGAYGTTYAIIGEMTYPTATSNIATASSQLTETTWKAAKVEYDGFDRPVISSTAEDGKHASQATFTIFSKTIYDGIGRGKFQTNPYRSESATTDGWTRMIYDLAGRGTEVATFSGSPNTTPPATGTNANWTGSVATNYNGTATTVTDQAGKQRRSITNALGQLLRIDEPDNNGNFGTINNPVQSTIYKYNIIGKMIEVTQGVQQRHFLYDALGRLLRIRQPEQDINSALNMSNAETTNTQWTVGFTYDNNANILTATDAKNVTASVTYDVLNRPLTRSYSDAVTPTVNYTYDDVNVSNSKGKLTKVSSTISEARYTSFDIVGRLLSSEQTTNGQTYSSSYKYNLAGIMMEQTYPSGRIVKNFIEDDGDLSAISSKLSNSPFKMYAANFSYTPSKIIKHLQLGNGLWESAIVNSHQQVTELNMGNSPTDGSLWKLTYAYGEFDANGNVDATKNSGNIAKQTVTVSGLSQPFVQTYKYDNLNRITEAKETNNGNQTWKQTFDYDRYGNRNAFTQDIGGQQLPINNLTLPQVDANTNRFVSAQGYNYGYDGNGNLTTDAEGRQFTFDGDNKQTEVKNSANIVVGRYFYDGNGKRVKKIEYDQNGAEKEIIVFVYDGMGKLAAEYSTAAPVSNPTTNYTATDPLGSPRVITNKQGQIVSRRDFMPFGEQVPTDATYRTAALKYNIDDNIRQKFTGYQRDKETGLDFAEARYYNNKHGRFTAVDPLLASGKSADPQTFNRYVYVMNQPLSYTDPTGLQAGSGPPRGAINIPTLNTNGIRHSDNSPISSSGIQMEDKSNLGKFQAKIVSISDYGEYTTQNGTYSVNGWGRTVTVEIMNTETGEELKSFEYMPVNEPSAGIPRIFVRGSNFTTADTIAPLICSSGCQAFNEQYGLNNEEMLSYEDALVTIQTGEAISTSIVNTDEYLGMFTVEFRVETIRNGENQPPSVVVTQEPVIKEYVPEIKKP